LTFDHADDDYPVWSPDGKSVVFSSNRTGQWKLYIKPADGSGEERLLLDLPGPSAATSWSRDGRFLLFGTTSPRTSGDIWALPDPGRTSSPAKPVSVLATQFNEGQARLSPDSRWIAYTSNEAATYQVYVRPFPRDGNIGAPGAKWLVSKGFGIMPRWRADSKQLFYEAQNSFDVMAVDIDTSKGFQAGIPRRVFTAPSTLASTSLSSWDVAPDGSHFLFIGLPNAGRKSQFIVVVNWQAGLKK
jgi:Tol biopolymer transport system component